MTPWIKLPELIFNVNPCRSICKKLQGCREIPGDIWHRSTYSISNFTGFESKANSHWRLCVSFDWNRSMISWRATGKTETWRETSRKLLSPRRRGGRSSRIDCRDRLWKRAMMTRWLINICWTKPVKIIVPYRQNRPKQMALDITNFILPYYRKLTMHVINANFKNSR